MSATYKIYGIQKADSKYHQMKKAYYACLEADIQIPSEVLAYFNDESPNVNGIIIDLEKKFPLAVERIGYSRGYHVQLDELPTDITHIQFVVSH